MKNSKKILIIFNLIFFQSQSIDIINLDLKKYIGMSFGIFLLGSGLYLETKRRVFASINSNFEDSLENNNINLIEKISIDTNNPNLQALFDHQNFIKNKLNLLNSIKYLSLPLILSGLLFTKFCYDNNNT